MRRQVRGNQPFKVGVPLPRGSRGADRSGGAWGSCEPSVCVRGHGLAARAAGRHARGWHTHTLRGQSSPSPISSAVASELPRRSAPPAGRAGSPSPQRLRVPGNRCVVSGSNLGHCNSTPALSLRHFWLGSSLLLNLGLTLAGASSSRLHQPGTSPAARGTGGAHAMPAWATEHGEPAEPCEREGSPRLRPVMVPERRRRRSCRSQSVGQ
eukprot:SAG31_NODE_550_length_14214_cov_3.054269_3_plen_210_part_00